MKFKPSSNQFMPTSCQLRVGQYARTISHDSHAPHSYDPTMGRRQRRQPINPPRCSPSCSRRFKAWPLLSQAQAVTCLKTSKDVFSGADFRPHVETSIFSKEIAPFRQKGDCPSKKQGAPNGVKRRQTAAAAYRPPLKIQQKPYDRE